MQFFHFSSGQVAPHPLLFHPPGPQIIGKTRCFATSLFTLLLCFSSLHIVGSLTSKLPLTSSTTNRALSPKNQNVSIVLPLTVHRWGSYSFERGPSCGCIISSLISALKLKINFVSLFAHCLSTYLPPPIVSLLLLMIVWESNLSPGLL